MEKHNPPATRRTANGNNASKKKATPKSYWILLVAAIATILVFWATLLPTFWNGYHANRICHECVREAVTVGEKAFWSPDAREATFLARIPLECATTCTQNPGRHYWDKDLLPVILSLIIITCAIGASMSILYTRVTRHRSTDEQKEDNTENWPVLVHAIPFAILSFALVFEIESVSNGEMKGVIAISGIMILFLLAELAAHVITHVEEAKRQAGKIEDQADRIQHLAAEVKESTDALKGAAEGAEVLSPMINLERLRDGYGERSDSPVIAAKEFLTEAGKLATHENGVACQTGRIILSHMLTAFLREAKRDMAAEIDTSNVPLGVRIPQYETRTSTNGYAYFASNLNTYTTFLADALSSLGKVTREKNAEGENRVPFIVTVTNHLPTHFFGTPTFVNDKKVERRVHFGVLDFYQATKRFVSPSIGQNGCVFRMALVRPVNPEQTKKGVLYTTDREYPLWPRTLWNTERDWYLLCDDQGRPLWFARGKTEHKDFSRWESAFEKAGFVRQALTVPSTDDQNAVGRYVTEKGESLAYSGDDVGPPVALARLWKSNPPQAQGHNFIPICDIYKQDIHPKGQGKTWVAECSIEKFGVERSGSPPSDENLENRNDVIFFGTFDAEKVMGSGWKPEDIWSQEIRTSNPSGSAECEHGEFDICAAATASMNPDSETMFVTLCYSQDAVRALWDQVRKPAATLAVLSTTESI